MTEETNKYKYLNLEGLGIFKNNLIDFFKNNPQYSHPIQGALTGMPTADMKPGFGESFKVSQVITNNLGHVTSLDAKTITIPNDLCTTTKVGLMSTTDKVKLDALEWAEYD